MKILLQHDDGLTTEIREIECLNKDSETLFFFVCNIMRKIDIKDLEDELKNKTGKNVVILDGRFQGKILGL